MLFYEDEELTEEKKYFLKYDSRLYAKLLNLIKNGTIKPEELEIRT